MKILVMSYSFTGNNAALADSVAGALAAEHIKITEEKPRTTGKIFMDLIFKKTPKVRPMPEKLKGYDLIIFISPVWVGQVATPIREYLQYLKTNPCRYAFISISGGADSTNPKLAAELTARVGREPAAVIDQHISDLLPKEPKPTRKDTAAYKINRNDIKKLTTTVVDNIRKII